jgi:leucyl-tRNA synthetase
VRGSFRGGTAASFPSLTRSIAVNAIDLEIAQVEDDIAWHERLLVAAAERFDEIENLLYRGCAVGKSYTEAREDRKRWAYHLRILRNRRSFLEARKRTGKAA